MTDHPNYLKALLHPEKLIQQLRSMGAKNHCACCDFPIEGEGKDYEGMLVCQHCYDGLKALDEEAK